MAEARVKTETTTVVTGVNLKLSDQEACALLYLLRTGVGGTGSSRKGPLGSIATAIGAAYGLDEYPHEFETDPLYARSGIEITPNRAYGYVVASNL